MNTIRIGLVGCGSYGISHLEAFASILALRSRPRLMWIVPVWNRRREGLAFHGFAAA